jgi:Winged helix DNA-binding domain
MTSAEILLQRQHSQRLVAGRREGPADVVRWLGAVQAQDYAGSLWAVALRAGDRTDADVEQSVHEKEIVRTWPMRGTLHFVPAADVRWMLSVLTPRIVARAAAMRRRLEIDAATLARAAKLMVGALQGGRVLTRGALYRVLESSRIPPAGMRGLHILWLLAQDGLLCFGPREGKQHTFTLLEEWLPGLPLLPRDVALGTLAERYFTSHGPATVKDFSWWSGLSVSDARAGLEMAKSRLVGDSANGASCWMKPSARRDIGTENLLLLPAFDEYMVGYADREAALEVAKSHRPMTAADALSPVILRNGQVIGTWRRTREKDGVTVTPGFYIRPTRKDRGAFEEAARSFRRFLGLAVKEKGRITRH